MISHKNCEKCGYRINFSFAEGSSCLCASAPAGSKLVIGAAGVAIGWTEPPRVYSAKSFELRIDGHVFSEVEQIGGRARRGDLAASVVSRDMYQILKSGVTGAPPIAAMAQQYPVINGPAPGSWEDPDLTIEIPIASGDLEVAFEKQCTGPAKQIDGRIVFGPALGNDPPSSTRTPCPVSVRRIRVRRSDLERASEYLHELRKHTGTSAGGDAYARGVAACREAIAAEKYDRERDHREWSVRDVIVPPDGAK